MTRPFFNKNRVSYFDNFDRHVMDTLEEMKARMREGYTVDWHICTIHDAHIPPPKHYS